MCQPRDFRVGTARASQIEGEATKTCIASLRVKHGATAERPPDFGIMSRLHSNIGKGGVAIKVKAERPHDRANISNEARFLSNNQIGQGDSRKIVRWQAEGADHPGCQIGEIAFAVGCPEPCLCAGFEITEQSVTISKQIAVIDVPPTPMTPHNRE